MTSFFDDQILPFECPQCQHEIPVRVGWAKDSPDLICPGCGEAIHIDAKQFREELGHAEEALEHLKQRARQLGIKIE